MRKRTKGSTGYDILSWPVLLLLLTVLIPSAGIVWMMRAAVHNERLAVRQRLGDAYRLQLELAKRELHAAFRSYLDQIEKQVGVGASGELFYACVSTEYVDSAIILDHAGTIRYPDRSSAPSIDPLESNDSWQLATRFEFAERDWAKAAQHYREVAEAETDPSLVSRAEVSLARCLNALGQEDSVVETLKRVTAREQAHDLAQRSVAIDAGLLLLYHLIDHKSKDVQATADQLAARLSRYDGAPIPAAQRLFAMRRLEGLLPNRPPFATLTAETIAASVVDQLTVPSIPSQLYPTADPHLWSVRSPQGRIVILMQTATLQKFALERLKSLASGEGIALQLQTVGDTVRSHDDSSMSFAAINLEPVMVGWQLTLSANERDVAIQAAERTAFYSWIAFTMLGVTFILTGMIVGQLRRQNQVSRMKNDLVATISHELKTPLASIRLLVDTLLEDVRRTDRETVTTLAADNRSQVREYLELIASENARLTRLIENFLTFSRMERGKQQFEIKSIDAVRVADTAASMVRDKIVGAGMSFEWASVPPLEIHGDFDALVMALVNLLENAYKYAGPGRHVALSVKRQQSVVEFCVADDGIGLSTHACRHVFDRFYQVDQRLSRSQGGCGLGLSIVQHIAHAHEGKVTVASRPGEGCQFVMSVPYRSARARGDVRVVDRSADDEDQVSSGRKATL